MTSIYSIITYYDFYSTQFVGLRVEDVGLRDGE